MNHETCWSRVGKHSAHLVPPVLHPPILPLISMTKVLLTAGRIQEKTETKVWILLSNVWKKSVSSVLRQPSVYRDNAMKYWMFLLRSLADIFHQCKAFALLECSCVSQLNNCWDSIFSHETVRLHLWCVPQCQHSEMDPDSSCTTSAGLELRPWCTALSALQRKDPTRGKWREKKTGRQSGCMTNDICWCAARFRPPGNNLVFQQSKFEDQSASVRQILKGVITELKKEWTTTISLPSVSQNGW